MVELTKPQLAKKLRFILLDKIDFHMINNLSIAFHAFTRHILMSLSVDEMLLLRYVNLPANSRELPLRLEMSPCLKHINSILSAFTSFCLLQTMQQRFSLDRCICKMHKFSCLICIHNSFCRVLSASFLF